MALRVGLGRRGLEVFGPRRVYVCALSGVCVRMCFGLGMDGFRMGGGLEAIPALCQFSFAINNQLRTGADKGTPTV